MSKAWRVLFVAVVCALGSQAGAQDIGNIDEIVKDLKVADFKGKTFSRKIKVAVLDNGFYGYEKELGKSLPKDTVYHAGAPSEADKVDNRGLHGLFMAQIIHQLLVKSGAKTDVEMHLFYAFGYTKFADAVKTVKEQKFDIVLYSQVWEYGGNGDGRGFINALVNEATENTGLIWINAAGNFGQLTRIANIDRKADGEDEWVQFKDPMTFKVDCKPKKGELCGIRLVLAWNDFKDNSEGGTDKDLDLFLLDSKKNVMLKSERRQKLTKDLSDPMASMFPREFIETKLMPGTYSLKVKVKSKIWTSQDQLRITLSGEGVTMNNPTLGETLLPPADNPSVIVVGASDDLNSNRSEKNGKPDVWLKSLIRMKDGSAPFESSIAAAMAAGVSTLHLGTGTIQDRLALLEKLKPISRTDGVVKLKGKGKETAVANKKKDTKTEVAEAKPEAKPPVVDSKNGISYHQKTVETKPVDINKVVTEVNPDQTQTPAPETKTEDLKAADSKPAETKTTETKVSESKAIEAKPAEKATHAESISKKVESAPGEDDTEEKPIRRSKRRTYAESNARLPYSYTKVENLLRNGGFVTYARGRIAVAVRRGQVDMSNMDDDQIAVISPEGVRFYGPEDLVAGLPADYYQIVVVNK